MIGELFIELYLWRRTNHRFKIAVIAVITKQRIWKYITPQQTLRGSFNTYLNALFNRLAATYIRRPMLIHQIYVANSTELG